MDLVIRKKQEAMNCSLSQSPAVLTLLTICFSGTTLYYSNVKIKLNICVEKQVGSSSLKVMKGDGETQPILVWLGLSG
jgi:hypothetical protein